VDAYKRDFFMQKIICGYLKYKDIYIYEPTSEVLYDAQQIYVDTYEDAVYEGVMTEDECLWFLIDNNIWSDNKEHELKTSLPELLDDLRLDLYNNYNNEMESLLIRKQIQDCRDKIFKMFGIRNSYYHLSAPGIATLMKNYYIIENSTFNKDGSLYDWSSITPFNVLAFKNSNVLSDEDIRTISKYEQWKAIWQSSKRNAKIFKRQSMDTTDDQKRLMFWSMFYDNIHEHPECPIDEIIDDDDVIDGWVVKQRREKEKDKFGRGIEQKLSDKLKKSNELFIVCKNDSEAARVENLNSIENKVIKESRKKQLLKRGEMNEYEFSDVQQKLYMEGIRKGNEMRGK